MSAERRGDHGAGRWVLQYVLCPSDQKSRDAYVYRKNVSILPVVLQGLVG